MSAMADLDIELSRFKLSDAQKNAVVEVFDQGWTTAKANTIKSLENKGILVRISETHHKLGSILAEFLSEWQGAPSVDSPEVEEVRGLAASQGIILTHDEAVQVSQESASVQEVMFRSVLDSDGVEKATSFAEEPYAQWELEVMGFKGWRNTDEAWTGLSSEEIKEDIKTAFPINRKARRLHTKLLTSQYRKLMCPRPRKQLKITGKVGV